MIDFRTAKPIFDSLNNAKVSHLRGLCSSGLLKICHLEEQRFRLDPVLAGPFIVDNKCCAEANEAVYDRCSAINASSQPKALLINDELSVYIAALCIEFGLGLISDQHSPLFMTGHDFASLYGFPVLTTAELFTAYGI